MQEECDCKEEIDRLKQNHEHEISKIRDQLDEVDVAGRRKLRKKDDELAELQRVVHECQVTIEHLRNSENTWRERSAAQAEALDELERRKVDLTRQLRRARAEVQSAAQELEEEKQISNHLRLDIKKQEETVTKAHATAISLLARDVSSDFPDDEIKGWFRQFLEGEFFGWCMDYRKYDHLADMDPEGANMKRHLERKGLLRRDHASLPGYLQLDLASSVAPAILLPAALAQDLCHKFLQNPLFLASDDSPHHQMLVDFMSALPEEETVDWRIHTCQLLERLTPRDKLDARFAAMAQDFADTFDYLHEPLDDQGLTELVNLYRTFGRFAMRLSQRRAIVQVQDLGSPTLAEFRATRGGMEAHSSVKLLPGDTSLDGRPVCAVAWPRIISTPVVGENTQASRGVGRPILWTNAVVWVSKKDAWAEPNDNKPMGFDMD